MVQALDFAKSLVERVNGGGLLMLKAIPLGGPEDGAPLGESKLGIGA
jgi:hypothetical protein